MYITENNIELNQLKIAKKKLELHYSKGVKSELSIFEVATLMDLVSNKNSVNKTERTSIFFSFSKN